MRIKFSRPLNTVDLANQFLVAALQLQIVDAADAAQHVQKAEKLLESMSPEPTLTSIVNRHPLHKTDNSRALLRRKIFEDLVNLVRLDNDEDIKIGVGGARPKREPALDKVAVILTGLPASRKSSIANQLAEIYGAFIVDSDFAKRKFPEFGHEYGADLVHEESSVVTSGATDPAYFSELSLLEFCMTKGINVIIPKIGHSLKSLRAHRDALCQRGYQVHLLLISLEKQEACRRALRRFLKTGRYVPLGLIFDEYANEPILTYYRSRDDIEWSSVGKVSSEIGIQIVYSKGCGPIDELVKIGVIK